MFHWRKQRQADRAAIEANAMIDPLAELAALESVLPPWHGVSHVEHGADYFAITTPPKPEFEAEEGNLVAFILECSAGRSGDDVLVMLSLDHARALRDGLTKILTSKEARKWK